MVADRDAKKLVVLNKDSEYRRGPSIPRVGVDVLHAFKTRRPLTEKSVLRK